VTPLDAALSALAANGDPFENARARAMLIAYAAVWDSADVDVLGVEQEFQAPLIHPDGSTDPDWLIGGKIDLILRCRKHGTVRLYDHKTSSEDVSPGSTFRGRLILNGQATTYLMGAAMLGYEPEAFVFDVLGKLSIEPLTATPRDDFRIVSDAAGKKYAISLGVMEKDQNWSDVPQGTKLRLLDARPDLFRIAANQRAVDETPEQHFVRAADAIAANPERYFAQIEVVRSTSDKERHMHALYVDSTLMDTVRAYDLVSRNEGACFQYGGKPCAYHPVCAGTANIDDPRPEGKRLITTSRRGSFNSCRQAHFFRYEQHIAPVERSAALTFGTLIHTAVERYWLVRASLDEQRAA
jgi:hypothetical protein